MTALSSDFSLDPPPFPSLLLAQKGFLNSPYKATTTQILQRRPWASACLPNATELPWGDNASPNLCFTLPATAASCFPSPCPTSWTHIYPSKHILACLLRVRALTAHHTGFVFVLEIGLVSSQTEMLLQMSQDFSSLGVYIGEIDNCMGSLYCSI